jgi:OmpA family
MVSAEYEGYELRNRLRSAETPFGSWRLRGMRPTPQYLRFLDIDQFAWNIPMSADPRALSASLTARHREMIERLAKHVRLSWKTKQPIAFIRLIGHTDRTGVEQYNLELGDWRAQAVKKALEDLLKDDILKRRIAIIVEKSPGSSAAKADNRTLLGRALNRRVEVFVAPPEPPPEPKAQINWDLQPPADSVIKTRPSPWPWGHLPSRAPGKSVKDLLDDKLKHLGLSKSARDAVWEAITDRDWGGLNFLLGKAHVGDPDKGIITGLAKALGLAKAQ